MGGMIRKLYFVVFMVGIPLFAHATSNAEANGKGWISLGVPSYIHIGTQGAFYLNGTDQGSCAGVTPRYFRIDMSAPYFKEFYSWLLTMQAINKPIHCAVERGCGTDQVWVHYCRGPLR